MTIYETIDCRKNQTDNDPTVPMVFIAYEDMYDSRWCVGVYATLEIASAALDDLLRKRQLHHGVKSRLKEPQIEIWTLEYKV